MTVQGLHQGRENTLGPVPRGSRSGSGWGISHDRGDCEMGKTCDAGKLQLCSKTLNRCHNLFCSETGHQTFLHHPKVNGTVQHISISQSGNPRLHTVSSSGAPVEETANPKYGPRHATWFSRRRRKPRSVHIIPVHRRFSFSCQLCSRQMRRGIVPATTGIRSRGKNIDKGKLPCGLVLLPV